MSETRMTTTTAPIFNSDAERSLLSLVLEDHAQLEAAINAGLGTEDFYRAQERIVYRAMLRCREDGIVPDVASVHENMDAADRELVGAEFVRELAMESAHSANAAFYAQTIIDKSLQRRTIDTANGIAALGAETHASAAEYHADAIKRMQALSDGRAANGDTLQPRCITAERATHPPAERFIVGVLFPLAKATLFYGPQGKGKSAFLAQLGFRVAAGGSGTFLGMFMGDSEPAGVLVFSAEDTFEDWERKAGAAMVGCPEIDVVAALPLVQVLEDARGTCRLTEIVTVRSGSADRSVTRHEHKPTPERLAIIAAAKKMGARLIIIETASRLVDSEDNPDMVALMAACGNIAAETGAAVVLSHHPTKAATKDNDSSLEGARGGGALGNNSRTAVSIFPADTEQMATQRKRGLQVADADVVVVRHEKGTSSVPTQKPITLVRCGTPHGAVLRLPEQVAADPVQAAEHARKAERKNEFAQRAEQAALLRLYEVVAELAHPLSKNKLRPLHERLGVPKNGVDDLVDRALARGALHVLREDSNGRILDLGLGTRPGSTGNGFDPRATAGDPEMRMAD